MGAFEYPKTNSRNGNKEELYCALFLDLGPEVSSSGKLIVQERKWVSLDQFVEYTEMTLKFRE